MKKEYKSIILLIIGILLTFLTYKASFLVEEKCIIPNVVDFSCIKSVLIFLSIALLSAFFLIESGLMIIDVGKNEEVGRRIK
jgi:uncharacterized membrane protein